MVANTEIEKWPGEGGLGNLSSQGLEKAQPTNAVSFLLADRSSRPKLLEVSLRFALITLSSNPDLCKKTYEIWTLPSKRDILQPLSNLSL